MKAISELYIRLEESKNLDKKCDLLVAYFKQTSSEDLLWSMSLLLDKANKRLVPIKTLKEWTLAFTNTPLWLFDQCHPLVKDAAETLALLLPKSVNTTKKPLFDWMNNIEQHKKSSSSEKQTFINHSWNVLSKNERIVFNKLITGNLRFNLSQKLLLKSLSDAFDLAIPSIAHRLLDSFSPLDDSFENWLFKPSAKDVNAKPYPFKPIKKLKLPLEKLGDAKDWIGEYLWEGVQVQWIKRENEIFIWEDNMTLISLIFPELLDAQIFSGANIVLQGTIVLMKEDRVLDYSQIASRLKRKSITKKTLSDFPAKMLINDVLELNGISLSKKPWSVRRKLLNEIYPTLDNKLFLLADVIQDNLWGPFRDAHKDARSINASSILLRPIGSLEKEESPSFLWELDGFSVNAVLLYVESSVDRRSINALTFALWDKNELIPIAKVENHLDDELKREIQLWVRKNTLEKFGPIKSVKPFYVFEITFENIAESRRKKSGLTLKYPTLGKYLKEIKPREAHKLSVLKEMLQKHIK